MRETAFLTNKTMVHQAAQGIWDVNMGPDLLSITVNDPEEMNLFQLYQFIQLHKKTHQNVVSFELVFWQRLIQPITTCIMMFLAIPFIFGSSRSATMGSRLLLGAMIGFGFHILNRFFGPLSQVFQLSPLIGGVAPTLFFAALAWYLMNRVKS